MDRSFKELILEKKAKGSLHDLKKCYTDSDPLLYSNLDMADPATEQKLNLIINQYNAMINVYLKNNEEFHLIQTQTYAITSGIMTIAVALISAFKDNSYAFFGLILVCIFSWLIYIPLITSIHKNRLYHETTVLYIRAIEDKLGLYNIPLRSKEFSDDFWLAFNNRINLEHYRKNILYEWSKNIRIVFIIMSVLLTLVVLLALNTMLSQWIEI
ncbi:MAG: hypothetical protein KA140_01960 [Caldisericia bacterium]|nr:hypothetical protein [Caldisericia bacterium]